MEQLTPAFQSILEEFHQGIEPEVMAERLKFCTSDECLELLSMGWNIGLEDYWDKVRACSKAMHEADVEKFKNCATEEERKLLVSGWDENHVWDVSVQVDADRWEACTTPEEWDALVSGWDAKYFEAVNLEVSDRVVSNYYQSNTAAYNFR